MDSSSPYSLFLVLLWLIPVSVMAQTSNNRTQGSSLTAVPNQNSSWTSSSGDFAFGFQQIESGSFLLAIWFDKIPEKTVIWSANGGNMMHEGSKIQLTGGQFVLNDPTGQAVWTAPLAGTGSLSYAAMLDSGNFVLASQDSAILWQSFDQPTDTILPMQVINTGGSLFARYSDTNYSSGRFVMQLTQSGSLALSTTNFPLISANAAYWTVANDGGGFQVIYNQSGYIFLEAKNGSIIAFVASVGASTSNFYQRAILEYDGVFRQYVYPKNSSVSVGRPMAWSLLSYVPGDICTSIAQATGSGACGFNSYCSLGNDQRPTCECPPGYSYLDPDNNMNGCKQDFVSQECDGGNDANNFYFRDMSKTNWPFSDYQHFTPVTEDWCRQACLSDCFCAVAVSVIGTGDCWFKKIPLSNGLVDNSVGGKAMIKIRNDNSTGTSPGANSDKKTQIFVGTLLLSSSAFLNLVLLASAIWLVFRLRSWKRRTLQLQLQPNKMMQGTDLRSFTYKELEEATDNFKEELGKGAFATVYKGVSVSDTDSKSFIAVKRLNKMVTEAEQEFHAELSSIGKTNHKNLVQLLGFCDEGQHRVLVYEYMRNGSLASYLFGNSRPSWYKRAQIALGTAKGLVYLHEECSTQIIHCDIKPQNILLDDSLTARISDFGLAKLLQTGQTRTLTAIRGTKGYVAPEWFKNMPVTVKIDVYSFGILLLELICCRKNFDQDVQNENQMILADWAYDCYEDRTLHLLVQEDEEAMQDLKRVKEFVMISIWCTQDDPSLRPTMKRVLQMLEGAIEVPLPPLNPNSTVQFKLEKGSRSANSIEEL